MIKNLQPNPKAVKEFFGHLTQDFETGEVIEIRCLKDGFTPNTVRFAPHAIADAIDVDRGHVQLPHVNRNATIDNAGREECQDLATDHIDEVHVIETAMHK